MRDEHSVLLRAAAHDAAIAGHGATSANIVSTRPA